MSQRFSFDDESDETVSSPFESTNKKKNFFDFEDEIEDIFQAYPTPEIPSAINNNNSTSISTTTITPTAKLSDYQQQQQSSLSSLSVISTHNANQLDLHISPERISDLLSSLTFESLKLPSSPSTTVNPRQAIERLISGDESVNLSVFRGKEAKLELLDYALLTGNVYALLKVLLFLNTTLKQSIFLYEIMRRPVAADHYVAYLRNTEQLDLLVDVLTAMGRYEDAAFAIYSRAASASGDSQIKLLKRALHSFTSGGPEVTQWMPYIQEQIALIEHQLPIEADDRRRETEGQQQQQMTTTELVGSPPHSGSGSGSEPLFVIFPRPRLVGLPLIDTLHYCCLYHYHLQENNFASPGHVRKVFKVTEKQFLWTALRALAKANLWPEIDNLFEYKSWLGSRKVRNSIPIDQIVEILHHHGAPPEMIEKYLDLIDDIERRLHLAKEFQMSKYAADVLIKLKDRKRLAELGALMRSAHQVDYVQRYIENALSSSTIKWRN